MTDLDPDRWQDHAACRGHDPATFFPEKGDVDGIRAAIAICETCPVVDACREHAVDARELEGIWGATTGRQRRTMRSARLNGTAGQEPARCGTDSGYYRHRRTLGEPACDDCTAVHRDATRARDQRRRSEMVS